MSEPASPPALERPAPPAPNAAAAAVRHMDPQAPPRIEARRKAGTFARSQAFLPEHLLAAPLALWSFMLLTVHFHRMLPALRGLPWVLPLVGLLIVNGFAGPAWRQPAVRVFNAWCVVATLGAHLLGLRPLSAGLMYRPAWFLESLTVIPGFTTLMNALESAGAAYGRFLGTL